MIEAVGLTKRYGQTVAVDNLSFTVQPGRVTGFLGPNGAGKSTTMRMILGLDNPTAGRVLIGGKPYKQLDRPLRTVGALLDAKWVHPNRSARAHLLWLARSNGLPARRVDEVLELVGLTKVAKRRAGGFSLGMSQRLGIAGALLGDPGVLLFDEPVNGLDPEGILWIRNFMQGLAADGRTVLVSSHLLSEMALTAEDLVVIGRGKLISQGSTTDFIERSTENTVLVRSPHLDKLRPALLDKGFTVREDGDGTLTVSGASSDQIGDIAAAGGVVLHELSPQRGSLEQAFMQLTGDAVEYRTDLGGTDGVADNFVPAGK
ncbi:ATP-binding cassette domain-containing protein [Solihabitans fulvus]|uniref:ATP-binding cassette domain-containing protein n=1 Tax=Solihabitans fulvus TaxID=1892852 RepID=A0A5B2WKJ4_9PSEU|nr:ATP-binding cassette domain-containing protein [Solihabitans fulvus]KAA2251444.1 ATP-binding cassette domain-containing protein [Solihabitans fulvus]